MTNSIKQLNPFEIKRIIQDIIEKFSNITDLSCLKHLDVDILDGQSDKKTIVKILYKELNNATNSTEYILRILLERYVEKEELIAHLWSMVKNKLVSNEAKIVVLNFLRDIDSSLSYEECGLILGDEDELVDNNTKLLLKNAITNPEVQIDFLDFVNSLNTNDKITLLESLGKDYSEDDLANILVPVFLSNPYSEEGKVALNLLGETKSQLALHALDEAYKSVNDELKPLVKKNISTLKLAGIREDNTIKFYKELLKDTKPYIFCATYPDGLGQQALIFTREKEDERIQFVSVVIDDYTGIKDCFGFNDISKFECEKIIERFYQDEQVIKITPRALKTILLNAEKLSDKFPYEYLAWRNLLADIEQDPIEIKDTLIANITPEKITIENLSVLFNDDFTEHWFLDYSYSDEFEEMLDIINTRLQKNDYNMDFNRIISLYLPKIFYKEEYEVWRERLIMNAYLKLLIGKREQAELVYGLYYNQEMFNEFLQNILRRSIYEYYFALQYNTELNDGKFSLNELEYIIKTIEDRWVNDV